MNARFLGLVILQTLLCACRAEHKSDDTLSLFDAQVIGTHNSYHLAPDDPPDFWAYSHLPLNEQASVQGVRHFEIDFWYDDESKSFDVFHLAFVDSRTTCATLAACLDDLLSFSNAHPAHAPIVVMLEAKNGPGNENIDALLNDLDARITATISSEKRVSPRDVRGDFDNVQEAIENAGWPTFENTRGRFFFVLDGDEVAENYVSEQRTLDERPLFVRGANDAPYSAFVKFDDPGESEQIAEALSKGQLVRTRADADTVEARANDRSRFERALASGAHFISTDFPASVRLQDAASEGYALSIPGGSPLRCNPLSADESCEPLYLEDPAIVFGQ